MKNRILTTIMMGAALFSTVNGATVADISVEAGVSYSNLSTSGGLAIRDNSASASISAESPLSGGTLNLAVDLFRTDDATEADVAVAWGLPVSVFGATIDTEVYFQKIDSSFGGWEEVGVALGYSLDWFDVGAALWHELGTNAGYGVELTVSREFATPFDGLSASPFVTVNFADSYNALEVGFSAKYVMSDALSVGAKVSLNDNDAGGSYALDKEWMAGLGLTYKF